MLEIGIKYYNNKSVKFRQRLGKIINNHYGVVKVVPYYKTGRKLFSYFSDKIKNQVQDTSIGVYKIPCTDCDLAYIGEKSLRIRLIQHESNCKHNSNHHKLGHLIDFENSCVIYSETKRKRAESLSETAKIFFILGKLSL